MSRHRLTQPCGHLQVSVASQRHVRVAGGTPCGPICCQDYEACLAVPMLGQFCFDYSTVTQSSAAPRTRPYGDSAMGLSEP